MGLPLDYKIIVPETKITVTDKFGALAAYLKKDHNEEENRNKKDKMGKRFLLIPINHGKHWVMMVVLINSHNRVLKAFYLNSQADPARELSFEAIQPLFKNACPGELPKGKKSRLLEKTQFIQTVYWDSGPLACENAFATLKAVCFLMFAKKAGIEASDVKDHLKEFEIDKEGKVLLKRTTQGNEQTRIFREEHDRIVREDILQKEADSTVTPSAQFS